jgi:hypothetical protein
MLLLPATAAAAADGSDDDGSGGGGGADGVCSSSGGGMSAHRLLDRMGQLVEAHLQQWQEQQQQRPQPSAAQAGGGAGSAGAGADAGRGFCGKSTSSNFTALGPEKLAVLLVDTWTAAYAASGGSSGGSSSSSSSSNGGGPLIVAVAAQVLGIAHRQPVLHEPLLRQLRQRLLQPAGEQPSRGAEQQHNNLAAAAMLATTAGALMPKAPQQEGLQPSDRLAGPQAAAEGAHALQPLFVWRLPGEPAEVPGPLWLHQLLQALPLGSGRDMAAAAAAAAAHASCLCHFKRYALLPKRSIGGCSGSDSGDALLVLWRRPARVPHMAGAAAGPGSYAGEWAASLVAPACAAALRLQQWLLLRLGVAGQLLGLGGDGPGFGRAVNGEYGDRAAKRPRTASVPAPGEAVPATAPSGHLPKEAEAVAQACTAFLRSDLGAALAAAAGKPACAQSPDALLLALLCPALSDDWDSQT